MVRSFADEPVAPDALERILDAARRGPSAGYSQGVEFVAVRDEATRREIAHIVSNRETAAATMARIPVHIVICASDEIYRARYREADKERVRAGVSDDVLWQVPFWYVDAGCAMMLALLAAVNEGLAAGFIGVWRPDDLRALLGIPDAYTPVGIVFVGHRSPDEQPQGSVMKRRRRPRADVLHHERW
jgi:nitroreductase